MTPPADLERLAQAATPGPWTIEETADVWELYGGRNDLYHGYKLVKVPKEDADRVTYWPSTQDAAYIAAASPDTILDLLARLRAAESRVTALETELRDTKRAFLAALRWVGTPVRLTHHNLADDDGWQIVSTERIDGLIEVSARPVPLHEGQDAG